MKNALLVFSLKRCNGIADLQTHCQEVEERSAKEVILALSQEIKQAGFMVHSKAIEVHGVCAKCQNVSIDQN